MHSTKALSNQCYANLFKLNLVLRAYSKGVAADCVRAAHLKTRLMSLHSITWLIKGDVFPLAEAWMCPAVGGACLWGSRAQKGGRGVRKGALKP